MSDAFHQAAQAILGDRGYTTDPDLLDPWLTDWRGRYTGKARALASPASTQEVAALVRLCAHYRVPIVPQGGNSGMSGGATPDPDGRAVLLSLRRMAAIRRFDASARAITCEAGVILQRLHETVEARGLRFPLTLGGKGSATVGGLVSTNAGGTQVLRHGTMRAQVLGIEAVLADGMVLDTLEPLRKDNRGFDLKQLLIGSEGTLGIVTAATLRLLPAIGGRAVLWAGLPSLAAARRLLLHFEAGAPTHLEGFEVIPETALAAVLAHLPAARRPLQGEHAWHALIEFVAETGEEGALSDLTERMLEAALDMGLLEDATIASSEGQAAAFWTLRDSISAAERAFGPAVQHDIAVPVARMADFVEHAIPAVEARFADHCAIAFGHLGDGNVHFHVRAPASVARDTLEQEQWEAREAPAISAFVHDLVTRWDGSISAEHGIGQAKVGELARLADPARLAVLRAVKGALDPLGILNPGKLLAPAAPSP